MVFFLLQIFDIVFTFTLPPLSVIKLVRAPVEAIICNPFKTTVKMKTTSRQLIIVVPALFCILIIFNSFRTADRNSIANGGGFAGGIHFNFNAVGDKKGNVVGHLQYNGTYYTVECALWNGSSAILYTSAGGTKKAFLVADNGEGSNVTTPDTISEPVDWTNCYEELFFDSKDVTKGNIQIR